MNKIVADIKIADLLELLQGDTTDYYICHNICWLLVEDFRQLERYCKYEKDFFTRALKTHNTSLPYYFYYNNYGDSISLTEQVFEFLRVWMKQIIPTVEFPCSRFYFNYEGEHALYDLNPNVPTTGEHRDQFERQFRINLLTEILKIDSHATVKVVLEICG
jgi:hypothetical protein